MSLLDDNILDQIDTSLNNKVKMEDCLSKELLGNGFVSSVIAEGYNISFAQRIENLVKGAISPDLQKHQTRKIYSIDCHTLRKGDAYRWLLAIVKEEVDDPILVIENVTQVPDGDRSIYDDPMYVTNLLLRSWKNENIFAGDLHIDRRKFTVILTCPPEDADILQRECGLCSYSWLGDFDRFLKDL
jgi:hypothetical protein